MQNQNGEVRNLNAKVLEREFDKQDLANAIVEIKRLRDLVRQQAMIIQSQQRRLNTTLATNREEDQNGQDKHERTSGAGQQ